jgi:catechol 2,3-dioxygenase-like lactoylglutathione lyase family enzyme
VVVVTSPRWNLVVLRAADVDVTADFYRCLGFSFTEERHGSGPRHLSAEGPAGVLEIYPAGDRGPDWIGLGFVIADPASVLSSLTEGGWVATAPATVDGVAVVRDPDGRRIELHGAVARPARWTDS